MRCVSGHSNSAVDLELATVPITDKVMDAVGGAWHITSRFNLIWIARDGLLLVVHVVGAQTFTFLHSPRGIYVTDPLSPTDLRMREKREWSSTCP